MGFFEEVDNINFTQPKLKYTKKSIVIINKKLKTSSNKTKNQTKLNGIMNLGCNCFLSCVIQLFYFISSIRESFLLFDESLDSSVFLKELKNIFLQLKNRTSTVDPTNLINSFGNEKNWFLVQQDVNECFKKLFEKMEKINIIENICTQSLNLFKGEIMVTIECEEIQHKSIISENFIDLKLMVSGKKNIYESFDELIEPINLIDENRVMIANHGLKNCKKFLKFERLPSILNLHLLRFEYDKQKAKQKKINQKYAFPEILDLNRFLERNANETYKLFAVFVHSGEVDRGHYIIYIDPKCDQNWHRFDDSKVTKCLKEEAIDLNYGIESNTSAYMLIYFKQKDLFNILNE